MTTDNYYKIAGHTFRLSFSGDFSLDNYLPFTTKEADNYLFHLSVTDKLYSGQAYEELGCFDDDIASIRIFKSQYGDYRFHIGYSGSGEYCTMDTDVYFREAEVVLSDSSQYRFFFLNNCLILLYAFASAKLDTLLMHASVIQNNGKGYLFLGKSGTGKSTHSKLWLKHIENSELLNDDNPVVRIVDGKAWVFGTPWSGKTPCYKNEKVSLKGIVKLQQAPGNKMTKLSLLRAYAAILPSCSCMNWENEIMTGVHSTIESLVTEVNCYQLDCLPDREAAILCCDTINR